MNNKQLKTTILITIISRIDLFVNLISNSQQIMNTTNIDTKTGILIFDNPTLYWILQILITIVIFYIVYKIFEKITEVQSKLKIQLMISEIRNYNNFIDLYKNHEFYLLPNETMESYLARIPDGIYQRRLKEEMLAVRLYAIDVMKDKKVKEIEHLILESYNLKAEL